MNTTPDFFNVNNQIILHSLEIDFTRLCLNFKSYKARLPYKYYIAHNYIYQYLCICNILDKYDKELCNIFKNECKVTFYPVVLYSWFYPHGQPGLISFEDVLNRNLHIDFDPSLLSRNLIYTYPLAVKEACMFASGNFPGGEFNYTKYTYLPEKESKTCYLKAIRILKEYYKEGGKEFCNKAFRKEVNFSNSLFQLRD